MSRKARAYFAEVERQKQALRSQSYQAEQAAEKSPEGQLFGIIFGAVFLAILAGGFALFMLIKLW